ncbi:hypothetical protein ERO13_A11G252566v2 [Gossypium hirsutum]|nr:hypothetical protein ERO13_A11G252566v2 [Gossypium hirsutum]
MEENERIVFFAHNSHAYQTNPSFLTVVSVISSNLNRLLFLALPPGPLGGSARIRFFSHHSPLYRRSSFLRQPNITLLNEALIRSK